MFRDNSLVSQKTIHIFLSTTFDYKFKYLTENYFRSNPKNNFPLKCTDYVHMYCLKCSKSLCYFFCFLLGEHLS